MAGRGNGTGAWLARAHGAFNLASGLWPLLHMPSFELVFGKKTDLWLVRTVAGLLVAVGWSQLRAADASGGVDHARRIGVGTASTLLGIDLVYVPKRRIPRTYLLDAAAEIGWVAAWAAAGRQVTRKRSIGG